ncbi:chemotaxis protein [Vibrio parahaemolyticus]|uniref:chemotaxis protein n=1 Tax=Vibrio parahaemolyticus TaxID=670 RepID=UPI0022521AC6|nr:chemotaxis protein [Vibrio parahaemolyticus]MCX4117590.1 chemotaxis protein [Vibrio parahaemolyticus]
MSIKQSIASLVILLSVSFSALGSQSYTIYNSSAKPPEYYQALFGLTAPTSNELVQKVLDFGCFYSSTGNHLEIYRASWTGTGINVSPTSCGSSAPGTERFLYVRVNECPSGTTYNPVTGQCEPDKPEPPNFCSSDEFNSLLSTAERKCLDDGGIFTASCNDTVDPPQYSFNCEVKPPPPPEGCEPGSPSWPSCLDDENKCDENHPDWNPEYGMCCTPDNNWCDVPPPESCTIFSPNWPACSGDTDIDPPSGGDLGDPDKPDGGGSGGTDPDKPEPDVDNTSDTLAAIKAMNKDVNSQLTGINNDMNKNQAETKSALDALKASVDLNTDTVVDNANHVANAIQGQSDMLSDIGNKTNGLLTSANNLLNNGFGQLSNELGDLQSTNQKGFGDVVDALNELGNTDVTQGQGEAPVLLYDGTQYANLLSEVETLKGEYKQILNDFKSYFNFNDGVNSGDFNPHNLGLNWHGNAINQKNQVMLALQDNAGIISAVVLFIFGMLGIRALVGAL